MIVALRDLTVGVVCVCALLVLFPCRVPRVDL